MNCPYCTTPIDEHEAKPCLDAWIATAVFGATAWDKPYIEFAGTAIFPLPYSTDIASAWQIVEKLGRLALQAPGSFDLNENYYSPVGHWEADFVYGRIFMDDLDLRYTDAAGNTAQLAICRAALKAVEYERSRQASA